MFETFRTEAGIYAKMDTPPPFAVANEYIAAELAQHIRLPMPPHFCAYIKRTTRPVFCSLSATLAGAKLPPIDPIIAMAEAPDLCAGVLLFDIWIANDDRHRRNISYQRERPPHKLTIFDHSHSLFYYTDYRRRHAGKLGIIGQFGARHCLLDVLPNPDYFDKWVARIKNVNNDYVKEILSNADSLGLPKHVQRDGYDYLLHRRDNIDALVRENKKLFRGVTDWGLLWAT
ncbi:MAG TPA: HipA family kinase [Longimicrobium sp.]|uniref:HipA family kinase n=1 Tax=Longimicrobium sp. TaxID=2029185 RepID=UPI002EDACB72